MNNIINDLFPEDPLLGLVKEADLLNKPVDNFVGWIYSIDYEQAMVMTNDMFKYNVKGIPHNCFLVASSFDPENYSQVKDYQKEVILLRVTGSAKLPQDDKSIQTKIDAFQRRRSQFIEGEADDDKNTLQKADYDPITRNQLQFHGLKCRVLGTFFVRDNELCLGSDLESFLSATSFQVYRPQKKALEQIINYVDPIRRKKSIDDAKELGINKPIPPFKLGTIRYTSTDRLHRMDESLLVPFCIQPSDFLARRTAVLGMTRTGKSNMIKQMVAVVMNVSRENNVPIGQLIYDINGEYANANKQDNGSIADVFDKGETIRYSLLPKSTDFKDLRINFYEELAEGFSLLRTVLSDAGRLKADYVNYFIGMSLEEPDANDYSLHNRWAVMVAAYQVLLYHAQFTLPDRGKKICFSASKEVQAAVNTILNEKIEPGKQVIWDTAKGLTFQEASDWFKAARKANRKNPLPSSTKGKTWVDETLEVILNMIAQKGGNDGFISGFALLSPAKDYHSPTGKSVVAEDIYQHLVKGKIVILDLAVGTPEIRERLSKEIAGRIFSKSMKYFTEGEVAPNILIYVEEAHNLIGKDMNLTETWPRIAKEGAKYRIGLVYATQEVSAVHPNILANTENWFITHLNNERELRELSRFYDFEDFSLSLLRAQDVGFARVKTLSSPYVVPVQIDRFDPEQHKISVKQR